MKDDDLGRAIAKMSAEYIEQLPRTVARMDEIWRLAFAAETGSPQLPELARMAHSIAGSGTTFGLPEASRTAREFELYLDRLMQSGQPPGAAELETGRTLLDALARAAQQI